MSNFVNYIWERLKTVKDPEIPVISVVDLGIITDVSCSENGDAIISITPTFTGCPALHVIQQQIKEAILCLSFVKTVETKIDKTIAWSTNRISTFGKQQIKDFGIAPPTNINGEISLQNISYVHCPHCNSDNTSMKVLFGSALCRSTHYCYQCKQSFEAFKPI